MKVLFINHTEQHGGAAIAANRLFSSLEKKNINVRYLVANRTSSRKNVLTSSFSRNLLYKKFYEYGNVLPLVFYKEVNRKNFSTSIVPNNSVVNDINKLNPDIVHIHWALNGFLDISSLGKIKRPVVWTLHDMWPITGGCHHSFDCGKYRNFCNSCPVLNSSKNNDLSSAIFKQKKKKWKFVNIHFVALNLWMKELVKSSTIYNNNIYGNDISIIPNGIDRKIFYKRITTDARKFFNLPQDKKLVLIITNSIDNPFKGYGQIKEELHDFIKENNDYEIVMVGNKRKEVSFKVIDVGYINDETILATLYSAVDVLLAPSIADNLPNAIIESIACGTPVVSTRVGGIPDIIDHKINGYLLKKKEADIVSGLKWVLENNNYKKLTDNAIKKSKVFNIEDTAESYINLYKRIYKK